MSINSRWKRNIAITITIFAILMSMLSPAITTFALGEATKKFNEESAEFLEDAEEAKDIIKILDDDVRANPNPGRNTINHVMKRLLYLGVYVNDVQDGVLSNSIIKDKDEILYNKKYACHPNSPGNLIDHNCNIPNFTTGLIQNIAEPFMSPFTNAEKTSSYSVFGLGVPKDIPGGKVPVNPNERSHTYTALELYGYNLQLTSYNGEWDQIVVSNSARMLSNFGVIDKITLAGSTIWNSVRAGVSELIENFSFNPIRWFGTIAKTFEAAASSGINTVLDTSELNVVATNAWKRPNIDKTLYNVYVLSDKEILIETTRNYFEVFTKELNLKADDSAKLNAVLARDPNVALLDHPFSYDPEWETVESIAARKAAEAQRASEEAHNANEMHLAQMYMEEGGSTYTPNIISPLTAIPEPVYYTESEQLGFWEEDPAVAAIISDVRGEGLLSKKRAAEYETYEDLIADWQEAYTPYFKEKFNALGETVNEIIDKNDSDVFQKHPHLDPKQGISKYACANPDGSVMRKANGTVEYLYERNNGKTTEYLNPNCGQARPPIGGGLFGTGWSDPVIDDTRHVDNIGDSGSGISSKLANIFTSVIRSLNSFIAKITNVILSLSFSPLLDELGINVIVSKLVESFRDTVFFPLAGLAAAIGAVMLFFQLLKHGSAWQLLASIAGTFLVFVIGAAFLLHPTATLNLVEELPSKIDNVVADAILGSGDDSSYCSTGEDKDGIRSAQCSVWGAMVFEPWVHLQFGTGYDNLYANGYSPPEGDSMNNTNHSLVGNAAVNIGNGEIVNNWAMYQLSKTKAGTINQKDVKNNLGIIDKDMYRLVDLQAGPNDGEGTDSRYFEAWAGSNNYSWYVIILTLVQSILMAFAIGGLGIAKIEVSFMFSISIIFLPFMLLYGLLPKGRAKLKGYVANLISLLLKRIVIVVMLAVLLKIIIVGYSASDTLEVGAMIAISISVAFLLYRKELLEMITRTESGEGLIGGNTGQVKEALGDIIPQNVKQSYNVVKAQVRGTTAGFVGGALGASEQRAGIRLRKARVASSLLALKAKENLTDLTEKDLKKKDRLEENRDEFNDIIKSQKKLSVKKLEELTQGRIEDLKKVNEYENKINDLHKTSEETGKEINQEEVARLRMKVDKHNKAANKKLSMLLAGERKGNSIITQALKGANHSGQMIGRTAERRIRSEGYAPITAYQDVKETVYAEGARKIADGEDLVSHDVYKEILSHSKGNKSKSSTESIEHSERGQLANHPQIQKRVRDIAKERKQISEREKYSGITPDMDEIEIAAKIVDRKRSTDKAKLAMVKPHAAIHAHRDDLSRREKAYKSSSKTEHSKAIIEKDIELGVQADEIIERLEDDKKTIEKIYYDREVSIDRDKKEKKGKLGEQYEELNESTEKIKQQRKTFVKEEDEQ